MLARVNPERADELMDEAQRDIDDRWHLYEQMVEVERTARFGTLNDDPHHDGSEPGTEPGPGADDTGVAL
jgi:hypothetical protein